MELYQSIVKNTQIFMATHNPIIAAQFEPSERFLLEFQENGSVTSRRGSSPEGDDPNDLLVKDFLVRNLYGKEGLRQWERFTKLQTLIQKAKTWNEKKEFMKEYMKIGTAYNFPAEAKEEPSAELSESNEVHTKKP